MRRVTADLALHPGLALVIAACLAASAACRAREAPAASPAAGPVRIGLYTAPLGFDPHLASDFLTYFVHANAFESLTRLDAQLRVEPALAESWESPNDLTWRLHLRPGVRFHDGRGLTVRDVVFSLERARRHPRSSVALYLGSVREVRAVGDAVVEIVTAQPTAVLLNKLAFVPIVPAGSPERIEVPVGTGPYRLPAEQGADRILLRAWEGYWGPRPPEPEVELRVVPDAGEAARLLVAGQLDLLPDLQPAAVERVRATPGCRVVTAPGLTTEILRMRVDRRPFSDLRVRTAVHLALDREELVRRLLAGRGAAATQPVGRGVLGFDPGVAPPKRDLARARQLMAEAGYPGGFAVDLELREGRRAAAIQEQLAEVGIRASLRVRPWGEMLERLKAGQVDFYFGGLVADSGDASDVLDSAVHTPDASQGYGDANYSGFSSPRVDRSIEAARRARVVQDRRDALQAAMRLAMEDLPLIPVLIPDDVYGAREGIAWTVRADGRVLASDVSRRR